MDGSSFQVGVNAETTKDESCHTAFVFCWLLILDQVLRETRERGKAYGLGLPATLVTSGIGFDNDEATTTECHHSAGISSTINGC
ncbi:MAG: hypothetical protein WAW03_02875 [Anaerolineae bacterium]|uniref:hypothetical protein n=1 Tax=Candidatus Amarolinea dominans TaxID=3140696 RepID=UPI001D39DC19|nr:hypothetical protein [Anaerolineae bacterium]MBK7200444.1 hypothetical protein [Anaerolineae bacterium]MBK9092710.1 hypothetical protein [Anaerolineae bacterium]MBK9230789.1 hypothetical protein [Anaerolineae bacterium]